MPAAPLTVIERDVEYPAQNLTRNRRMEGLLAHGLPGYTYEVKWSGTDVGGLLFSNTWEPAECLIGWREA